MNKIIKSHQIDIAVYKSSTAESIRKKKEIQKYDHITRSGIFRFLWMGVELTTAHKEYLMETYPQLREATVFMAFHKAMELGGVVAGPKKLGTFGASYLYPIFMRLGVIKKSAWEQ